MNPTSRREYLLYTVELQVGDRIRWSLAWNACTTSPTSSSGAAPAIDLDLLLYKPNDKKYVFGSQSVDDNNEGFDYVITSEDGAGVYEILVSRPATKTEDCNGATTLTYGSYGIVL